ncbi:LysR family transcriptional regulator [Actibacterium sp. MT2.3-13A]|uniref:LysR family transcriptional regulator n=1 Tax=Actibacterium sp. MT2.3-13A TaxID=2828332 RepID=UPI001BA5EB30|nr:LysR family transcriptional regulator [Actibacterium sp. MT2.3-13A]
MDWRAVTFDWNRARAFLVTAEEGSLSAAARALGLAQPTLGRQVAALEEELGVALFERAGRGLTLTPTGLELLEHVRRMGEAAGRVSLAATGHSQQIEGSVTISAGEAYAAFLLPPILSRLRLSHPGIRVEIVASNTVSDLRRREADIAIRNARPADPELIARRMGDDAARLYAAPAYLDRLGPLRGPGDLARADFIGFDEGGALREALNALGLGLARDNFTVLSGSHLVQWECVRRGLGIGVMPAAIGDADPLVRRVLPDLPPIPFPVWLTAHRELHSSRRIRLVFDLLAEALADLPETGA